MFGLTKKDTRFEIIDATFIGNMGRYLNHSCDVTYILFSQTVRRCLMRAVLSLEYLSIRSGMLRPMNS